MRIGILTFHNIPNIGALLQAYALCTYIRNLGEKECYLLDYTCDNIKKRELIRAKKNNFIKDWVSKKIFWPRTEKKINLCQAFMRDKGLYSEKCYRQMKSNIADDYGIFISGSDMIWNLDVTGRDFSYFLDFLPCGKARYSYASSVGGEWKKDDLQCIAEYLAEYRGLSTRENDTAMVIQNNFELDCRVVPDPTMLLSADEWQKMTDSPTDNGYVLVYFPYSDILEAAKRYARARKLKVIVIENGFKIPRSDIEFRPVYTPTEWLGLINNAESVFTDSYHGFLFALYFNKNVWTANRNNRFVSIMERLKLEKCLIYNDRDCNNKIDYSLISPKIAEVRKIGEEYIGWMLEDAASIL